MSSVLTEIPQFLRQVLNPRIPLVPFTSLCLLISIGYLTNLSFFQGYLWVVCSIFYLLGFPLNHLLPRGWGSCSWPKFGSSPFFTFLFLFPFWVFGLSWFFLTSQAETSFIKAHGLSFLSWNVFSCQILVLNHMYVKLPRRDSNLDLCPSTPQKFYNCGVTFTLRVCDGTVSS